MSSSTTPGPVTAVAATKVFKPALMAAAASAALAVVSGKLAPAGDGIMWSVSVVSI